MLTVKHVDDLVENVFPTEKVTYQPGVKEVRTYINDKPGVTNTAWHLQYTIGVGTVYVMNEVGKTVATYKLGEGKQSPIRATSADWAKPGFVPAA